MSCECSVCGRDTSSKFLPIVLAALFGIVGLASVSIVSAQRDFSTMSEETVSAVVDSKFMRVSIGVDEGEASKTLVIQDVQGKEFANLLMFRDGAYLFQPNDTAAGQHLLFHDRKKLIEMGARNGNFGVHLQSAPSGAVDLLISDANGILIRTVRIREVGKIEVVEAYEDALVQPRLAGPAFEN